MKRISLSLVLCVVVVLADEAPAALVTAPASLNPGSQYRLVFVSTTKNPGTSALVGDYNSQVQTTAMAVPELAALNTNWTAIASTLTVDARDNTSTVPGTDGAGIPIFLVTDDMLEGEIKVADNYTDLWDGTLDGPIKNHENGMPASVLPAAISVWTGSETNGTKALGGGPFNTQSPLGGPRPVSGLSSQTSGLWIKQGGNLVGQPRSLYAISDILLVVPEPSTATLAASLTAGFLIGQRRRRSLVRTAPAHRIRLTK